MSATRNRPHRQAVRPSNSKAKPISKTSTSILQHVEAAEARGWKTFPLRPDQKVPAVEWKGNPPPLDDWPEQTTGYGIDCGRSGLTVIDIDGQAGKTAFELLLDAHHIADWPDTYTVRTQSGGDHLYFYGNGYRNSASKLADHVDVRANGGYVVGTGSVVNGNSYTVENDSSVKPLPTWLAHALMGKDSSWFHRTLDELAELVASANEGTRNDTLNQVGFAAYMNDRIDDDDATEALTQAALDAGLDDDEIRATLNSARTATERERSSRIAQVPTGVPGGVQRPTALVTPNRGELWTPSQANFDFMRFDELSDKPLTYRIPGLLPVGTNVVFSAYAKSGKTTTVLNLVNALTSKADFLDLTCTTVAGRVVYVNFELNDMMLRQYAKDAGIQLSNDKLRVWQLQGRQTDFKITSPAFQETFAERLAEADCEVLVIDPLAPVTSMLGIKEEDNGGIRAVLDCFGTVKHLADIDHVFIVEHTGHADKKRARAASANLDWPDVIWNQEANGNQRTLTAWGRGVDDTLTFRRDAETGLLTSVMPDVDGGDTSQLLSLIRQSPGINSQELSDKSGLSKQAISKRTRDMQARGMITVKAGSGPKPASYWLAEV